MANKTWKSAERRVAKTFGTTRTGPTGRDDSDVVHALLAIEIKYRRKLPKWALDCLAQAKSGRTAASKTPVVIMLGKQMRVTDGLLLMTVKDFQELWGPISGGSEGKTDDAR